MKTIIKPSLCVASLTTGAMLVCSTLLAAPIEFTEDFSSNTLRYTIDERFRDDSQRAYELQADRLVLSVAAQIDGEQGRATVDAWDKTDSFSARVSLSSDTVLTDAEGSRAKISLNAHLYNEVQDRGFDDVRNDIIVQLEIALRSDGNMDASYCFGRELVGGGTEPANIIDGGECGNFTDNGDVVLALDTEYTLSLDVDRSAGTVTMGLDDFIDVIQIDQVMYLPARNRHTVKLDHRGLGGRAVAGLHAISTDNHSQDFAINPLVLGPWRPIFDLENPNNSLNVEDGRARLDVPSTDSQQRLGLTVFGESDSIQSTLELSSESVIAPEATSEEGSFAQVRLGGTFYNDTAEGGFNGNEGNVFAAITIRTNADGTQRMTYCAFRANDANFSDTLELTAGEVEPACLDFGIAAELDTPYAVSIELDRVAAELRYTANEVIRTLAIATPMFSPAEQFISVQARASGGSRAVAFVDDYQTAITNFADGPRAVEDNPAPRGHAICASADSDSDGDGWGWENSASCVVAESAAQQLLSLNTYPTCTSVAVAIDEFGWGWENNATCTAEGSAAQRRLQR